ncbi:MAG: hypothetical protein M1839_005670 [Geoglossum umbratile]|nr:MAG: hypothetical protein M1839_005670 [Geoglossum umbratile]
MAEFNMDFGPLEGGDVLDQFDFDSFLNTDDTGTLASSNTDVAANTGTLAPSNAGSGANPPQKSSQLSIHSTISKDQTGNAGVNEEQLLAVLSRLVRQEALITRAQPNVGSMLAPRSSNQPYHNPPPHTRDSSRATFPAPPPVPSRLGMPPAPVQMIPPPVPPQSNPPPVVPRMSESRLQPPSQSGSTMKRNAPQGHKRDTPQEKKPRFNPPADGNDNIQTLHIVRTPTSPNTPVNRQGTQHHYRLEGQPNELYSHETSTKSPSASSPSLADKSLQVHEPIGAQSCTTDGHVIEQLYNTIRRLESEKLELQAAMAPAPPPRKQILHRVHCDCDLDDNYDDGSSAIFLEPPRLMARADARGHLEGRSKVNVGIYLERNQDVALLVYKDYSCEVDSSNARKKPFAKREGNTSKRDVGGYGVTPFSESASFTAQSTCDIMNEILSADPELKKHKYKFNARREILAPYLWLFHNREIVRREVDDLDDDGRKEISLFIDYIEESFQAQYDKADELFSQGLVSLRTLPYLIAPNDLVITHGDDGEPDDLAYKADSWLTFKAFNLSFTAWAWKYDGVFQKENRSFYLHFPRHDDEVRPLRDLPVYPLRYASPEVAERLRTRGKEFWSCRFRKYIRYDSLDDRRELSNNGARCMIDISTYKKIHPDAHLSSQALRDDLGPVKMCRNEPPSDEFLLLLPAKLFGFNMQEKKWCTFNATRKILHGDAPLIFQILVNLKVQYMSSVIWNKKAFDSLVVDDDTKELVKALVTNQLAAEKGTDLMIGKGNGLVILLHGGPGTGKTLTAESVAELAEKPLYRVTCGDIGTDADAVETYLNSVLHLGKTWGCVVLLDEADVFLEERSLSDLQRNALVSVFLRVLEYYDGILILTSNRVGTFDEAFKSRIQLALHYDNLTETQRRTIWENFIKRLETIEGDNVNIEDLRRNIGALAKHDMNGRQIRNALTTARQLAQYKGERMNSLHLKHSINVSGKFDQYLKSLKHGVTDDELAREGGVR